VFLHGFLGHPTDYAPVIEGLRQVEGPCPTLGLALAGHPEIPPDRETACDDDPCFKAELARLAGAIKSTFSEPVEVVGYSMGGRLALGLTVEYPALVRRLVLVSSRRGLDHSTEREERRHADEGWARLLETQGVDRFLAQWWDSPLFSSLRRLEPARLKEERERRCRYSPAGLAWALRHLGLGSQPSYAIDTQRLAVPVTLVVGELDEKFLTLGRNLVEQLPKAHLVVVKGHGHHLLLETPEAIVQAILEEPPL
jgi:2-succinyl-6-hydroxy-2,4-cyclohexadiene-1-carboxylate synthase